MTHSLSSTPSTDWPPQDAHDDALAAPALAGGRPSRRARRAEALARIVLDDAAVAAPLQKLVRRAADLTGAETAQISILSTRQIAIAVQQTPRAAAADVPAPPDGLTTPLEDTVCAVSVRADAPLCIPDTRLDNRVASLPPVLNGAVGAYLGSPIHVPDGSVVGVLCTYDRTPHAWTTADEHELGLLAAEIGVLLDRLQPVEEA